RYKTNHSCSLFVLYLFQNASNIKTKMTKTIKTIIVTLKEKFAFTLYIMIAPKAPSIKLISILINIIPFLIFA
ncbi:hypothetical protein, partial [Bacillus paralicheniformis]|uniref:hypothetical protein n=1 Tax=Bacillus paralicheniformis TaxID=1648923 RepID=UPI00196AC01A